MRTSRRLALSICAAALIGVPAALAACTSSSSSNGELFIAIDTNVELPKNIDNVELDVQEANSTSVYVYKFAYPQSVASQLGVPYSQLPSTLGVVSGSHAGETITVTLLGNLQGTRVFQRAVTTIVPTDRTAILRLVLDGLCLDSASVGSDGMSAVCPDGQSCLAGGCASALVDPTTLDTFTPSSAYADQDAGACFSSPTCFQNAPAGTTALVPLTKDASSGNCTIAVPVTSSGVVNDDFLNIAVPVDDSLCSASPCLVPLDSVPAGQDPLTGWARIDAATIQLPNGVCSPTHGSAPTAVFVSTACAAKTSNNPLCGAWDSITTPEPTADGGILASSLDAGGGMSTSGDASTIAESDGGVVIFEDGGESFGDDASVTEIDASTGGGGVGGSDASTITGGDSGITDSGVKMIGFDASATMPKLPGNGGR